MVGANAPLCHRTYRVLHRSPSTIELSGLDLRSSEDKPECFKVPPDQKKQWDTMGDDYLTLSLRPTLGHSQIILVTAGAKDIGSWD
ncbi:hypothetical protein BDV33DRAFT_203790 [Aspergillus novoparasiticus]|uniref:Uncharacterized protein n=1 Tax=Aspergillus novoparasiticus TaxID=986946 RepID=A0A5N6ERB1_9EURO|nr:hypothetical protein BDV33DRAFT_203790 [Aspergillus novoparasiticus]